MFGLLCSSQGCPIAVEVFPGNTADPATLTSRITRIRRRFGMARVALVGDRGMITTARIRDDLEPAGLAWVSALKTADLRRLASGSEPALSPEALLADAVAGITSPDFPGERLMVCLNPRLREDRRRTREALLEATEEVLETIAASVRAGTLKRAARIGHRVGRDANRRKVEKHFDITITDSSFSWRRCQERIDREARFDGVYVVRTSLEDIAPDAAVEACKSLASVERAFRVARSDLRIRPVRVYVEWNMRQRLTPLLFEDDDRDAARRQRTTPVEKAQASPSARRKAQAKLTPDGLPVHSFRTLIDDLASVAVNVIRLPGAGGERTNIVTQRTRLQSRGFEFLEVNPDRTVPINMTG